MRKLLNLAIALAFPIAAMAVTPVAVWDGASEDYNFSELTRNGYTLGQIGGDFANTVAVDGSYLQIAPNNTDAAITLKKSDSSNMGASTVIIKVEDIPADEGANRAMLSFLKLGSFNNNEYTAEFPFIGVAEERNRTRTSSFIWNNEIWNDNRNVRTDNAFSAGSHTVALAYSYAAGAAFYVDGVQRGASADLKSSGYNPLGVAIGGVADTRTSNKFYSMTGMKVTAVAFFDSKISDSDVANYVFPSDAGSVWTATVSSDTAWADIVWNKAWESDMSGATVQLTIESGATVTAPASLTVGNLSVSGAGTLTFAAGENTLSGTASIGTKVTLANGVTLKTSGVVGLTSSANDFSGGSLLDVVSGSTSLNAKECGLSGDITVESGATLVNLRTSDALNYDANPVTTVRVYGTLDFGTTRWSTRGVARNCYYFYDGAVVKGSGQSNYGALDFIENSTGGAINLEGSVTLSAAIRLRNGANVALINANAATLALSSTIYGDGTVSKAGAGTLTFSGVPTLNTLTVSDGTLAFTTASDVTMTTKYTAKPDSANMAYTQQSNWKGTVLADWSGANGTQFDVNAYGNANSVVEVTKLEGGFVSAVNANVTVVPTVKVSGTMKLDNGYSGKTTTFTKLTGSGTFTQGGIYPIDINVLDGFTGTIVGEATGGTSIGIINLAETPSAGDKLFSISPSSAILYNFASTRVSVNGVVDDTIKLEVKSDGIYVMKPVAQVTSADGQTVTPYYDLATAFANVAEDETLTLVGTAVALDSAITLSKSFTLAGDAEGTAVTGSDINLTGSVQLTLDATIASVGNRFVFGSKDAEITFPTRISLNVRPYTGYQTGSIDNGDGTTTYYQYLFLALQVGASNVALAYYGSGDPLVTKQVYEGDEIVFTATPAEGYENPVVVVNGDTLAPVEGKYTIVVGTANVIITASASEITTYEITGETQLVDGAITVPASTTTIMLGAYDVTTGFTIDGTTATLNAPEVVEATNKKAVDVGATTVTLNVDLVPGLYYGVAASTGLTFNRPNTLVQYTGSNDAAILTVTKPSAEKGFFKVFVDIAQ